MDEQPLVCTCPKPIPELIPLFNCYQCRRCLRALSHPSSKDQP